jgi:hypothetical protein
MRCDIVANSDFVYLFKPTHRAHLCRARSSHDWQQSIRRPIKMHQPTPPPGVVSSSNQRPFRASAWTFDACQIRRNSLDVLLRAVDSSEPAIFIIAIL